MSSLEVVSLSSIPAGVRTWRSRRRGFANVVACKATYRLVGPEAELAAEQELLTPADAYWDNDPRRSLRAASDWAPYKRRTDVILVGSAYAPAGTQVRRLVACLDVGGLEKVLEVRCDRWVSPDGSAQEGAAFGRMPLVWERAGGGPETPNPAGMKPERDTFGKIALPNLRPIGFEPAGPGWHVPPVGYGPIAPSWPTRMATLGGYASTWNERWVEAGLPDDLDFSYFQAAPRDQQLEAFSTDAQIVLENLHPKADRFVTRLAGHRARAVVEPELVEVEMVCDTVVIDTDRLLVTLTWRGSFWATDCPRASRVVLALETIGSPISTEAMLELASPGDDTVNLPPRAHLGNVVALPFSPAPPGTVPPPPPSQLRPHDTSEPLPSFETAELMAAEGAQIGGAPPFSEGSPSPSMIEDPATESRFDVVPPPPPSKPSASPPPPPPHRTQLGLGLVPPAAAPTPPPSVRKLGSLPPSPSVPKPTAPPQLGAASFIGETKNRPPPPPKRSAAPPSPASSDGASKAEPAAAPAPAPPPPAPPPAAPSSPPAPPSPASPPAVASKPAPVGPPPAPAPPASPAAPPPKVDLPAKVEPPPKLDPAPKPELPRKPEPPSKVEPPPKVEPSAKLEPPPKPEPPPAVTPAPKQPPPAPAVVPAVARYEEPTQPKARAIFDLSFYAHGALAKIRSNPSILRAVEDDASPRSGSVPASGDPDRIVGRALARVAPLDRRGVRKAVLEAVDPDGLLVRPLVVVEGELQLDHDPLEVLRTTVGFATAAGPASSKDVEAKLRAAEDLLREDRPATTQMILSALAGLREALGDAAQSADVLRVLVEERKWCRRAIVGGLHLSARLRSASGESIIVYLPEDAGSRLPLLASFPVRLLVEPHLRQEEGAEDDLALVVLALARSAALAT